MDCIKTARRTEGVLPTTAAKQTSRAMVHTGGAPPPGPQQGGRQPRQEGDVEAGDGDDMGQPRPAEGGIVPVGQPGPVPGKQAVTRGAASSGKAAATRSLRALDT